MSPLLPDQSEADFAACRAMLREGSKSFAAASLLLPARVRRPAAALYAFCRMADDAIDEADDPGAVDALRRRLDLAYGGAPFDSPIDRAFARVAAEQEMPRELMDALIVNPYSSDDMARKLSQALTMPLEERQRRFEGMRARVFEGTAAHWCESFIAALEGAETEGHPTVEDPFSPRRLS